MDSKLEEAIINKYMDFRKLIEYEGHWVAPNGLCFCIFHRNQNTKSAKLFDNDGGGQLFCFSEYKQYFPYDYYKLLHPEINTTELAQALYNRLSNEERTTFLNSLNIQQEYEQLPYLDSLIDFKEGRCTYKQLLENINKILVPNEIVKKLYNLPQVTNFTDDNKYFYFMNNYPSNYKLISSYMILQQVPDLPDFVAQHLSAVGDCILIPNIIDNQVQSITFRSVNSDKRFLKFGEFSALFYGLGCLKEDFKYGTPIIITEGNLDCDYIKTIYPNALATLTSTLTTSQITILTHLTNKIILAFDNDEAGERGFYSSRKKLKDIATVTKFEHDQNLKDFGDLLELEWKHNPNYQVILQAYKNILLLTK